MNHHSFSLSSKLWLIIEVFICENFLKNFQFFLRIFLDFYRSFLGRISSKYCRTNQLFKLDNDFSWEYLSSLNLVTRNLANNRVPHSRERWDIKRSLDWGAFSLSLSFSSFCSVCLFSFSCLTLKLFWASKRTKYGYLFLLTSLHLNYKLTKKSARNICHYFLPLHEYLTPGGTTFSLANIHGH